MKIRVPQHLIDKYGKPGSKINGSHFFRGYCPDCLAPMRVLEAEDALDVECEDCYPHKPPAPNTGLSPRQRHKLGNTGG